ncbi:PREDICTED: uncharacterized protein LOC103337734 [Prunus mume]|uniref:Uncharacterized protein LOC103337734 n=1 Tax=Prunus mume TaxID=102107 RepID=A0ABM0PG27_PRUMU|nr:PREDICTED: uncharacterized protein LOC103337734 [Prunus mume]
MHVFLPGFSRAIIKRANESICNRKILHVNNTWLYLVHPYVHRSRESEHLGVGFGSESGVSSRGFRPSRRGLAAREAKLKREIEKQRHENAVLEEMHEFERLERLKTEDELKQSMVKAEAVSEEKLSEEKDKGNEVISELQRTNNELESSISRLEKGSKKLRKRSNENTQRRRSGRLASMDSATNNNGCASSAAVEGNGGLRISGYTRVAKMQMKRKNMKKKILGRKKKGKKKRGRTQEYAQYRCNMRSFFNTMQRIKECLTKGHLELLQQTPFWPLISAFYNGMIFEDQCWKSESDIHNIISCYNSRTMSFDFGSTSARLTNFESRHAYGGISLSILFGKT